MSLSKVSERIRKILALSKSSNPGEAANAVALAQKLMQEHKLTEADVTEMTTDGSEIIEVSLGTEGFLASWKFALVTVVSRAFFCEAIALRADTKRKIKIIGRQSDTELANYVFSYLVKEIERLASEDLTDLISTLENIDLPPSDVRAYKDSFRRGAAIAVANKLKAESSLFAASSEKALAISRNTQDAVMSYMRRKYNNPKEGPIPVESKRKTLGEKLGMERGYQAGAAITIPTRSSDLPNLDTDTQPPINDTPDPRAPVEVFVTPMKPQEPSIEVTISLASDLIEVYCPVCGTSYNVSSTAAASCPGCKNKNFT